MERLLFVCTGNLCRSPMAAGLAGRLLREQGVDGEVRSAGTHARPGEAAHAQVIAVCRELGVDLSSHRSARLDEDGIRWANRIFVMEPLHGSAVRELVPDLPETRIVHLGPLAGKALIEDPIGSWFRGAYRATREQLVIAVHRALGA
jgi:protein-tyrosine-phosphatase